MGRFNKVRGVGRKDKENQALRDRIAELEDALARKCGDEPGDAPTSDAMPKAKKRSRRYTHYDLRKLAYDYYEFMGGDVIDMKINNERAKCRAFASQMRVAEGRDHFNDGAWGPNITPYEERMGGALIARLIKQKDALLEKYKLMMKESLDEQYEISEEAEEGEAPTVDFSGLGAVRSDTGTGVPQRLTFSEDEKQQYLDALTSPTEPPAPAVVEIMDALKACAEDPRRMTPDVKDLFDRSRLILEQAIKDGVIPEEVVREYRELADKKAAARARTPESPATESPAPQAVR
ncbi:MAG: hypothetical protein K8I27_07520 [Planctomycetes bacterium]|nr:hypothetical protein [Planctomycetota bacterium]